MKKLILLICTFCFTSVAFALHSFSLYDLTCEQEENPVGIESLKPCFSWKIYSEERGFVQSAYQIMIAETVDELKNDKPTIWNSGKQQSWQSVLVPFSGISLKPATKYYWKVRVWNKNDEPSPWSLIQTFSMGLFSESDWEKAQWIALEKDRKEEYIVPGIHGLTDFKKQFGDRVIGLYKLPQFRKSVTLKKKVKRAVAYISGLGHFDFFMNGEKIGNHFLDAGWTKYDKQALYVSFDVTNKINEGENALGVMLGNGFYNVPNERYFKLITSYGAPKMKMLLKIEYNDGSVDNIVSDKSWRVVESPLTYSSIYGGEDYDATKEIIGWKTVGFNDKNWMSAIQTNYPGKLISQRSTPLTVNSEIPAARIYNNGKGLWVYDLGQNFSGIVRFSLKSSGSKTVLLRPAELLNPDSTVNQSATGSPYYFLYKSRGENAVETWQPQFSYYGFRYVQIEGAVPAGADNPEGLPEILNLVGLHTCNSAPEAGTFVCSKPMFNQIYTLIDWAMRSNMASVLTDCPHREKLGWLEQAHLMQYSLQYRYNLSRMYGKIEEDMCMSQRDDGCVPTIAPEYVRFASGFEDTPEWGSTFIISPWYIYKWYGDKRLLENYYPYMQRYIDYLGTKAENHIVAYGLGDWFDIGPGSPGNAQLTANGVTATAIYYYDVTIMSQIAELLGNKEDAVRYKILSDEIKKAFNDKFFDVLTKKIERNSQTASAMSMFVGLVDDINKPAILQNLIDDIRGRNNALTAGDIGYRYVLRALEEGGRSDIIFDMNSKYDVPGYGWQLAHGATALTESWQAYGFVSNNHFMLGHLMEWLFSGLGGIRQSSESVGFHEVIIDPQIVGDVKHACTTYESPYGNILCKWAIDSDGTYSLEVSVPANTTANVVLPTDNVEKVMEYGIPLSLLNDVKISNFNNKLFVRVGSGNYRYKVSR